MKIKNYKLKIAAFLLFLFGFAASTHAATLYFVPEGQQFGIGEEFSVDIKTNTEDISINAAQATVHFPTDVLELLSVEKSGSTFNFWVEEPTISNEDGTLKFIGGTAKGVTGPSLQIVRMKFKSRGAGTVELTITDAVVTASDGKGTNVLSTIEGASIAVGTNVVKPLSAPKPPTTPSVPKVVEEPKKVERVAVKATGLPEAPQIRIPLYPDESKWYNHLGEISVFWELPDDVVQVSTRLSRSKDKKPGDKDEELYTGKSVGTIDEEGVWYVRVQFRNNVGWGPLSYYKISVDTTAPIPFEVEIDNEASDNPIPKIIFETQDSLSGILNAHIFVDGRGPIVASSTSLVMPPQLPGQHTLMVKVFDLAGNSVEDDLDFEIFPLPTPTVDFITKAVSQEEFVFAAGKSIPNGFVDVRVFDEQGTEAFRGFTTSGAGSKWEIIIEETLARGNYTLTVTARDDRGAISYPTEAEKFKIKAKTVVSFGVIDLGWFEIVLLFVLLVVSGSSWALWFYFSEQDKRSAYKVIAGRDVDKLSVLIETNAVEIEELLKDNNKKLPQSVAAEVSLRLKKLRDVAGKMKKYLGQELNKLK